MGTTRTCEGRDRFDSMIGGGGGRRGQTRIGCDDVAYRAAASEAREETRRRRRARACLLPDARVHARDEVRRQARRERGVRRERRRRRHLPQLTHVAYRPILRRVHDHGQRPHDAQEAPEPSESVEALAEDVVREHRGDDDGERAERRDDDRGRVRVRREVGDLADDHGDHPTPPQRLAEVAEPAAARAESPARARELQALLLDDEAAADGERGGHRERDAEGEVGRRRRRRGARRHRGRPGGRRGARGAREEQMMMRSTMSNAFWSSRSRLSGHVIRRRARER
jgi:hypothetical protein